AGRYGVPATPEMSGHDAVFILPGAELELAARALRFGLMLNASATCIAPRRVFVPHALIEAFEAQLGAAMSDVSPLCIAESAVQRVRLLALDAIERGGRILAGGV